MSDIIQRFVDSYGRIGGKDRETSRFFDAFYRHFIAASPEVAEKFANTDMGRQREMLRLSLDHMVYFAIDGEETAAISRVADAHGRGRADIPPHLFDTWLDSLLATVEEFDPGFDAEVGAAWRHALAPAISYMKDRYPSSA